MSEQQSQAQAIADAPASIHVETASEPNDATKLSSQILVDELTELGAKFARLAQATWNSADRKALEERLKERLEASVSRMVSTWEQDKPPQQLMRKIGDTAETAGNTALDVSVVNYSAKTMLSLMHAVGAQVDSLADRLESGEQLLVGKFGSGPAPSQEIPVEQADTEQAEPDIQSKSRRAQAAQSQAEEKADSA